MVLDPREREQLNRLKRFWRSYGKQMTLAVSVILCVVVGFNLYNSFQNKKLGESIELYEQFRQLDAAWRAESAKQQALAEEAEFAEEEALADQEALADPAASSGQEESTDPQKLVDNVSTATSDISTEDIFTAMEEVAELLRLDYKKSAHAAYANLRLASLYVQYGDSVAAQLLLEWVLGNTASAQASMRAAFLLAQLLLEQDKTNEALALIDSQEDVSAEIAELRGDILSKLDQGDAARAAYNQAIARGANRQFILYKISLLPPTE